MSELGIADFALMRGLGAEDCSVLLDHLESFSLAKGRTLFREGGEGEGLVLVRSGALHVKSRHSSDEMLLEAGGVLGGLSLAMVGGRETTAVASVDCELWILERSHYRRLVDDYPRVACRLVEGLLGEVASRVRAAIPDLG